MKFTVSRGVLDYLTRLAAEGVSADEIEEKFKVVKITAQDGVVVFETRSVDAEVKAWSPDAVIEVTGVIQIDFSKLLQLASQINVEAVFESNDQECRISSGSATWRLKVRNFELPPVLGSAGNESAEVMRTETLKDVLTRVKGVTPADVDVSLDPVRMVMLDGSVGYATDRVRVIASDFAPALQRSLSLSRRMTDMLLKFIATANTPTMTVVDEPDFYVFMFNQSIIKAKKLVYKFPLSQVKSLLEQPCKLWFSVRREDLIDGLKKAIVTSEYGEPRVAFSTVAGANLELTSEDVLGNRGHVVIPSQTVESNQAVIRAELIRALIDGSRGERIEVSLYEGKFIKLCSEGVSGILMTMTIVEKGKSGAGATKSTKSAAKKGVGARAGTAS